MSAFRVGSVSALLAMAAAGCGQLDGRDSPPLPQETPVRVAAVTEEVLALPVTGTGVLGAGEEVRLSFKLGGVVARMGAAEGERVRAGQVLAELDLREIDARVEQARSAAAKAERDLGRARNLYADSVATLEQVQNATTAAEVARAELAAATFNRRHARIVALRAGVVLRRFAEVGELVAAGAPVLVLAGDGAGRVLRVGVPDRDVVRLRAGDEATVRFDAFPGRVFAGRVAEVAAAAHPQTGTYEIEISVQGGADLPVGLIGLAEVRPSATERIRLVPIEAIVEADGERGSVFVLEADARRARRLAVEIAYVAGDRVAIRRGLENVTRVVTAGVAYLEDGAAVKVVP